MMSNSVHFHSLHVSQNIELSGALGLKFYNFQEFIHSLHVLDWVNDNHQIICPLLLLKDKTSSLISRLQLRE